jgi:hypothetical protein
MVFLPVEVQVLAQRQTLLIRTDGDVASVKKPSIPGRAGSVLQRGFRLIQKAASEIGKTSLATYGCTAFLTASDETNHLSQVPE